MKYIATISFGKDSVAMVDLLLKNNYPLDYIIFADTFAEFKEVYEYKKKIEKYLKEKYNKKVITIQPDTTFEEWVFGVVRKKNAKKKGYIRGIPTINTPCYWKREAKVKPTERWIKENIKDDYRMYLGYTTDEIKRIQKDDKYLYPLIYDFKMSEKDCLEYTKKINLYNPLYDYFNRTGCSFCPYQKKKSMYQIYKHFPETWEYMKWIEKRLLEYKERGRKVINPYWFVGNKSIKEIEEEFNQNKAF
jgi:3'-phosphoadenosine 5'-phosphosulfate sulfotransferase (PAPS reductase)/FAD synthetase